MFSQPGRPSATSRAMRAALLGVGRAGERRLGAAGLRPRRQQAREQGRAGAVRVLVEGHVEVRARRVDQLEQRVDQLLVERLQVREVQRRARTARRPRSSRRPPRARRGPRCGRAARAARRTRPPPRRRRRARRSARTRRGCRRGRTRASARPPPGRARTSRRIVAELLRGRLHVAAAEHELAHRAVADRRDERERGPRRVERVEVLGERRPRPLAPGPRPRARAGTRAAPRGGPGATGAGASPSGQITSVVKPCSSFGVSSGSSHGDERRVRVQVDEAGAEHRARAVDDLRRLGEAEVADRRDPPVRDARRRRRRGGALARVDRGAADDEVKQRRTCRRRRTGSGR